MSDHTARVILGTCIRYPELIDTIGVSPAAFGSPTHAALWSLMRAMRIEGAPIDEVTVPERVQREGPARYGGIVGVVEHTDHALPGPSSVAVYVRQLLGDATRRRVREALQAALERIERDDPAEVLSSVMEVAGTVDDGGSVTLGSLMDEALEEAANAGGEAPGIPTGLGPVDVLIGGLEPGRLYVLAARPGMGKSAVAAQVAEHIVTTGTSVLMHNLEMSGTQLALRAASRLCRIDLGRVRRGALTPTQWDDAGEVIRALTASTAQLWVDTRSCLSIDRLEASMRAHAARRGVGVVVVDYLQLIEPPKGMRREEAVALMSRRLKTVAKDIGVAVLLLAQLNRAVEAREDKMPRLSDLRESGAIEQDADVVLLLMRPAYYDGAQDARLLRVRVAKSRDGRTGDTALRWHGSQVRVSDDAPDVPAAPAKQAPPRAARGW